MRNRAQQGSCLGKECTGHSPKSFTTNSNDLPDSVKIFVPNCAKTPVTNKKQAHQGCSAGKKPSKELKTASELQNAQGWQQAHASTALRPIVQRYHGQKSPCSAKSPFDGKSCARKTPSFAGHRAERSFPSALPFGQDICTSGTPKDAKGPPLSQVERREPSKCGSRFPAYG